MADGSDTGPLQTLVYIDADPDNRLMVQRVLELTGRYRVLAAADPAGGLELISSHHPALVLTDLDLPLMSGFDLLRRIRSQPESRGLPVVAMSAAIMKGERQRSLGAGFDAFVEKPFDIHALRALIAEQLDRASARGGRQYP
jgi:two-component system cell cycle response regulator DivK